MTNKKNIAEKVESKPKKDRIKEIDPKPLKARSCTASVLSRSDQLPMALLTFELVLAFFVDIFQVITKAFLTILAFCLIIAAVACIVAWAKIKPYVYDYSKYANEVVSASEESTFFPEESTFIYDKNGDILAKLRGDQDSSYLAFNKIPEDVVNAFVAIEDQSFWDNSGIDYRGIVRVIVDAIESRGEEVHGASTITQQLARNVFLSSEVSFERKGKEMFIALEMTKKYSKQEILEYYINNIYFGNNYYGIEAAANGYFSKPASELSLSETAYLCAIPNRPSYYNPFDDPDNAIERRDHILRNMLECQYINQKQYDKAIKEKIRIKKASYDFYDNMTTYAVDCATRYMMSLDNFEFKYSFESMDEYREYKEKYNTEYTATQRRIYTGGYKIYTTLDPDIQQNMQDILDKTLAFDNEIDEETKNYMLQGAVAVMDNRSGKVIAAIGGRTAEGQEMIYGFNRAYQAVRQPGSTIKPLAVYMPALMNGYTPDTVVENIDVDKAKEPGANPQEMHGEKMSLRVALEKSRNGVAWQIFDKFGAKKCLGYLNKMEFASICPDDYYNSSSLGGLTNGVTPIEMAAAYRTLLNHGNYNAPTCIDRILNNKDENIYSSPKRKQIYDAEATDTLVDMMTGVLKSGTAAGLRWSTSTTMAAAAKTGTTNKSKDGWFCGFTPYYTVSVWVGYDQPKELSNLFGATYPGQIWKECMLSLIEDKDPIAAFEKYNGEQPESTIDEDEEIERYTSDLPEYLYEKYYPGHDDSELITATYTVYDYRKDRMKGENVLGIINKMTGIDKNDPELGNKLIAIYNEAKKAIEEIKDAEYRVQLSNATNEMYLQVTSTPQGE